MSRLIDKILIHVLSVFAMCSIMHGNTFLVVLYISITCSALNYYLINREDLQLIVKLENVRERIAFGLEILAAIICIIFPPAATALPIITYDITRSRNYPGMALVIIAFLRCIGSPAYDTRTILYVLTVILLSVIISIYTEEKNAIKRDYRKLRDDSEEKNTLLRSRNTELLQRLQENLFDNL